MNVKRHRNHAEVNALKRPQAETAAILDRAFKGDL